MLIRFFEVGIEKSDRCDTSVSPLDFEINLLSDGKLYCFQVYVYRSLEDAVMLKNKITQLGYQSYIFEVNVGNRIWFSVRVGYFESLDNTKIFKDGFFKKIIIEP